MNDKLKAYWENPKALEYWTNPANIRVEKSAMTDGNVTMKVACHHRSGGKSFGNCGGCAARMDRALTNVEALLKLGRTEDALKIIEATNTARRAESTR